VRREFFDIIIFAKALFLGFMDFLADATRLFLLLGMTVWLFCWHVLMVVSVTSDIVALLLVLDAVITVGTLFLTSTFCCFNRFFFLEIDFLMLRFASLALNNQQAS
jgi:hypothetical protein